MIQVIQAEYAAFLRQDLAAFIERCFYHLYPDAVYQPNWHIDLMAAELVACLRGENRRLIFNLPPRHLKSLCVSVAFVAWLLGHNPSARIMCVSYGDVLAVKFSRDCRDIMMSDWYQELFPTRLSPYKQSVDEFETTEGGFRIAVSAGGPVTGRGADYIIIDDPQKPEEAFSDTQRKATNAWFPSTLYSRLNDKKDGCIILVMQRLHEDDLAGHLIEQGGWKVVSFPAIAIEAEEHLIHTPYGSYKHVRQEGQALHPARESLETLESIRRNMSEYDFAGQYQQVPVPFGGGLVKEEWLKYYEPYMRPAKFDQVVQSWDTANKAEEFADPSVCTTWGIKGKDLYLLDVRRERLDYPDLKRAVRAHAESHGATVVLIEDKASGTQLIQDLKRDGFHKVIAYKPEGDKVMRLHAQTAMIQGFLYLPKGAPWLAAYVHELITFPRAKYDDQVDSTSQALDWIKQGNFGPGMGVFQYYRQEYERLQEKQTKMVRLKSPTGHGAIGVHTLSGRWVQTDNDGVIEVSEEDAKALIAHGWRRV